MDAADLFSQHPELKNLRRALQLCKGFGLYFVSCNTILLRQTLVAALKTNLAKPILELPLVPENDIYIDVQMSYLLADASDEAIVFIYDLEKLHHLKDRHVLQELNRRREHFGRINHPVVFWLPDFLVTEIFRQAPDFADWRSGVYEFHLPEADKLSLMTSTWESVSKNFVGQLSLEEKQRWILNLENLLEELAEQEPSKTQGELFNRLGLLYFSLGNYEKALTCYQKSLVIQQAIGDKEGEGTTLNNLSQIYQDQGDYDNALRYLNQALAIQQAFGHKAGESRILNNLATLAHSQGDYGSALRYLTEALTIQQAKGDKAGEGTTLNNLASLAITQGNYDNTLHYLTQALAIQQAIGDKTGEGATLNNLGQIYQAQGDYDNALHYLTQTLAIDQAVGNKASEGTTLNNLSQIYQAQGDYNTALRYLTKALAIQQTIGDRVGECPTLFNIGLIHLQNGEIEQALAKWLQVYRIAKQIGLAEALQNLDKLAQQFGGEGLDWWEALSQAQNQN